MREIWLHNNRRAIGFGMIGPAALLAIGIVLSQVEGATDRFVPLRWFGVALGTLSLGVLIVLAWQLRQPRIARHQDQLLLYLRSGPPLRVPLAIVEGFLLGQGASFLRAGKPDASQAATVVIRLAERATEYANREVKPALGSWCNHYVTIRGTWCEPLSVALVTRLNERLAAGQSKTAAPPARTNGRDDR